VPIFTISVADTPNQVIFLSFLFHDSIRQILLKLDILNTCITDAKL